MSDAELSNIYSLSTYTNWCKVFDKNYDRKLSKLFEGAAELQQACSEKLTMWIAAVILYHSTQLILIHTQLITQLTPVNWFFKRSGQMAQKLGRAGQVSPIYLWI